MHSPRSLKSPRRPARGFTLIELLTVIAIIGILAAIIIPTVGSVRNKAKAIRCTAQLRVWSQVVRLFANDNKGNIALTMSVGTATNNSGSGKLYSPYFGAARMENLGSADQATLDPMDYFSSCPSVDRTGLASADARRNYGWVAPIGVKTVPSGGAFFGRTDVGGVRYYNLERASAPTRLFLMMEQKPDSAGVILGSNFGSEVNTKVKDLVVPGGAAGQTLIRHNGVINVLYLDGHISSLKWQDIDVNSQPPAARAGFAISYTL